jgi:hypothetical protein
MEQVNQNTSTGMTPEQRQELESRRDQFLAKTQKMQSQMMTKNSGPAEKEKFRQYLLMEIKRAMEQMGITPDSPDGSARAEEFLKLLPEWMLEVLAGGDVELPDVSVSNQENTLTDTSDNPLSMILNK